VAALTEVRVPDIGDFDHVPVIEVLVTAGDTVAADDPLIVLESDKATMEVPAPSAGTVAEVRVKVGDQVSQGDVIVVFTGDAAPAPEPEPEKAAEPEPEPEPEPEKAAEPEPAPEPEPEVSAPAEAQPQETGSAEPDVGVESDPAKAGREAAEEHVVAAPPVAPPAAVPGGTVYAGPGARRLARDLGVDLTSVQGTGHKGRVTKEDVQARAGGATPTAAAPEAAAPKAAPAPAMEGLPAWPKVDFASFGPVEVQELTRIQRIAGPALARNWATIPHVTQFDEADITELEAFRKEVNAQYADRGVKLTMVSLLLKACAGVLRQFPAFNSSLDGGNLILKRYFHLGFAADTPNGLVVPVIRDVDRKGLLEIATELVELSGAAREGTLKREQMQGGTFTISSLGGIGGTAFTPIINAPEVAILGVSKSATKPVWNGTEFVPRLMLPLSLSYDHRVIDGAAAARFITQLSQTLGDPRRMLL